MKTLACDDFDTKYFSNQWFKYIGLINIVCLVYHVSAEKFVSFFLHEDKINLRNISSLESLEKKVDSSLNSAYRRQSGSK